MRLRTALLLALGAAFVAVPGVVPAQPAPPAPGSADATRPAPPPALEPLGPAQMLAHRAAYALTLDRARDNSDIARATGAMLFEVVDACEGWATRQRMTLTLIDRDGQQIETSSDYSTYETKDGTRFRFSTTQMTQGAVSQRITGEAELNPDGSGVVNYVEPSGRQETLGPGTLLPMRHTIDALNAARAGRRMLVAPLFDGTSDEGSQETTTVLSAWQGPTAIERFPLLGALGSVRMRIAFFDRDNSGGGASAPEYEVGMRYWDNGVADEIKMDFGDFVVDGRMIELLPVPGGC